MAHGIPKFKRIEQLKNQALVSANISQMVCNQWLNAQAAKAGTVAPQAKNPYKFYGHLLGLSRGDLNGRPS